MREVLRRNAHRGRTSSARSPRTCRWRTATVDAAVAAQAFHWFDGPRALAELARVLPAGAPIVLVWNVRDEIEPWVRAMTELIEPYRGDTPSHRSMRWRAAFEGDAERGRRRSSGPRSRTCTARRARGSSTACLSISFIATLAPDERERVAADVRRWSRRSRSCSRTGQMSGQPANLRLSRRRRSRSGGGSSAGRAAMARVAPPPTRRRAAARAAPRATRPRARRRRRRRRRVAASGRWRTTPPDTGRGGRRRHPGSGVRATIPSLTSTSGPSPPHEPSNRTTRPVGATARQALNAATGSGIVQATWRSITASNGPSGGASAGPSTNVTASRAPPPCARAVEHRLGEVERGDLVTELRGEQGERAGPGPHVQHARGRRREEPPAAPPLQAGRLHRVGYRVTDRNGRSDAASASHQSRIEPCRSGTIVAFSRVLRYNADASRRRYSGTSSCSSPSTANDRDHAPARASSRSSASAAIDAGERAAASPAAASRFASASVPSPVPSAQSWTSSAARSRSASGSRGDASPRALAPRRSSPRSTSSLASPSAASLVRRVLGERLAEPALRAATSPDLGGQLCLLRVELGVGRQDRVDEPVHLLLGIGTDEHRDRLAVAERDDGRDALGAHGLQEGLTDAVRVDVDLGEQERRLRAPPRPSPASARGSGRDRTTPPTGRRRRARSFEPSITDLLEGLVGHFDDVFHGRAHAKRDPSLG